MMLVVTTISTTGKTNVKKQKSILFFFAFSPSKQIE